MADSAHKSMAHNGKLMQVLNNRVLETVQKSGLDFFHYTEKDQRGSSFGTRFSNAIQEVFEKGYEHVICVGNDTPQLSVSHINAASRSLNKGIATNGPSLDGGFYMMGMSRSHFESEAFENLPWQTAALAGSYLQLLNDAAIVFKSLAHLADLDSQNDLDKFLQGADSRKAIIQLILGCLATQEKESYSIITTKQVSATCEAYHNKGSPQLAA